MGFFGDILKGAVGIATKVIPGPIDDIAVDAISSALGGSGKVSNRSKKQSATQFWRPEASSPPLAPVGMQSKPQLPDIQVGGGVTINPPFGGRPGMGVDVTTFAGPMTQAGAGRAPARAAPSAQLPMVGAIATAPDIEQIERRDCGPGRVLALDGLCYPKKMLPKSFRMHPPAPKPVVSAADRKAIQRAERTKKRLVNLTKQAGAHASLTKPRRK